MSRALTIKKDDNDGKMSVAVDTEDFREMLRRAFVAGHENGWNHGTGAAAVPYADSIVDQVLAGLWA